MSILYSTHAPESFLGEPDEDDPPPYKVLNFRRQRARHRFLCDECQAFSIVPGALYTQLVTLDDGYLFAIRRFCKACGGAPNPKGK
jgi:hypothetical protein